MFHLNGRALDIDRGDSISAFGVCNILDTLDDALHWCEVGELLSLLPWCPQNPASERSPSLAHFWLLGCLLSHLLVYSGLFSLRDQFVLLLDTLQHLLPC